MKSLYYYLGREGEKIMREDEDKAFFRNEIVARQAECKPEADGFITVHPKVR